MKQIQWYPGHMAKAKKTIAEDMALVDLTVEVRDARIPQMSANPQFEAILAKKPRIILLNKEDLAEPAKTAQWLQFFRQQGFGAVAVNAACKKGLPELLKLCHLLAEPVMQSLEAKGRLRRPVRIMMVGVPNTGKSTLINALVPRSVSKTGNRPGVTRGKQWVRLGQDLELLDTPGVLWPKFDDPQVGFALAVTGAIRLEILEEEELACQLLAWLAANRAQILAQRYHLQDFTKEPYLLLEDLGRQRGLLAAGAKVKTAEAAALFLAEFRNGKLGRLTLEDPPKRSEKADEEV